MTAPGIATFPASAGQERLWLLAETEGSTVPYAVPFGYHVRTRVPVDRLRTALRTVTSRHDALRTGLRWERNRLLQYVHPTVEPDLTVLECDSLDAFREALRAAAGEPFDLAVPPLFRALYAPVEAGAAALGFVFHHAICDSWALELFMDDLAALLSGRDPEPDAGEHAPWSVAEHAWLDTAEADRSRDYWRDQVGDGIPPLEIGPGTRRQSRPGAVHGFTVPAPPVDALTRETATTRFAVMLAAFSALLRRYSTNERISVGLPIAGRNSPAAERIVGYLSNTIVVVDDFSAQTSLRETVDSTFRQVVAGLEHGRLPFQEIVKVAGVRRDGNPPLYRAMFGPQNTPVATALEIDGHPLTRLSVHNGTAKCDLTLLVESGGEQIECELEYDTDLFSPRWAQRFCAAYSRLLEAAARTPDARIDELALLAPEEMIDAFAARGDATDYRHEQPAHRYVEAQARATPDAVAVKWSPPPEPGSLPEAPAVAALTYRELDERANALAHRLVRAGAGPRHPVGILLDRGPELICAVLATLKAGAGFVPLDGRFPASRTATISADAGITTIVTSADRAAELPEGVTATVPDTQRAEHSPDAAVRGDDLMFIYYTSGSTGTPKGVPLDHRCVSTRLAYMRDSYPVAAGEALLHKTPLIFDIAIWEIFLPLFAGGTIVIAETGRESDGGYLHELLRREPIVMVHFVPSVLDTYLDSAEPAEYPRLRWVIASGEAVTTDLLGRAKSHFGVPVHTQYGQTETSEVTVCENEGDQRPTATALGWQVGAYSLYVVDPALHPVPPDVPGELCVSAPGGLAWGYLNRPALTAERFVPHPNPTEPGERLYRTGDLARMRDSGLIEYLGRTDQQVKIRGCRVEPGEIENVLGSHPGVASCVVTARSADSRATQLIAYVIGTDSPPAPTELAEYVGQVLPWFMVPAAFVLLPDFPRTMSGKVARDRLPEPGRTAFPTLPTTGDPPAGPLEDAVAAEWARVLDLDGVGRRDDFFSIGGTSLSAVRVLSALGKRFGIKLSIADFTRHPTVATLAESVETHVAALVNSLSEAEAADLLDTLKAHESGT